MPPNESYDTGTMLLRTDGPKRKILALLGPTLITGIASAGFSNNKSQNFERTCFVSVIMVHFGQLPQLSLLPSLAQSTSQHLH